MHSRVKKKITILNLLIYVKKCYFRSLLFKPLGFPQGRTSYYYNRMKLVDDRKKKIKQLHTICMKKQIPQKNLKKSL